MRKNCAVLALCLLLSGCVVGSLNPFYTEDTVVKMPELYGSWYFIQDIEANDESPMVLSEGKMTIYDDKGVPEDAPVTFFKVDDTLFIDVFPNRGRLKEDLVKDQPPVHLVSRVKVISSDKMSFNALDYEWLAKEIEAGTMTLPHQRAGSETDIVFTASSAEWIEFLRQHKDDPRAFPNDGEAGLVRKMSEK
jgi:hypothetical protein